MTPRPKKDVKIDGRGTVILPVRRRGLCRWCGKKIKAKRRRTWCGPECVRAFEEADGRMVKEKVRRRDKGICKHCGIDTNLLRKNLPRKNPARAEYLAQHGIPVSRARGRFHDIHHVKPVAEGGKMVLSNLISLCIPCHETETRRWNASKRASA